MQEAIEKAAKKYLAQRTVYRDALLVIENIGNKTPENKRIVKFAHAALIAYARARFRDISGALTDEIGCRLTCLPEGYQERFEVEHAVPLNLIHDRILGVKGKLGIVDNETYNLFPTVQSLTGYIAAFMVGVRVTKAQHGQLKGHSMHGEWQWLIDIEPWDWDQLSFENWCYDERPEWLQRIMGRYEHVPMPYRPTTPEERW